MDPSGVNAGDFRVDGIAATGVSYTPGSTMLTFTFATNPVTTAGAQTMQIPANAFFRAIDTAGVLAFSGQFYFDNTPMAVVSTMPPAGGIFHLPGPLTYDITFNEPVNASSVAISDLTVNVGTVTGFSLPNPNTIRFTVAGIVETTPITISLAVGSVSDSSGNPNPTAFSASYNAVACIRGDLSNDGMVDGEDVRGFVQVLINGGPTIQELCAGDLAMPPNQDIDQADVPVFVGCLLAGGC